jgi:signal peptidase II
LEIKKKLALIAFATYLSDNFSKFIVLKTIPGKTIHLLGSFLQLQLAVNTGAAFSLAEHKGYLLSAFSLLVLFLISYFGSRITQAKWAPPMGLMAGGALGNLSDRLFRAPFGNRGSVIDWIELAHWTIFNIADLALTIGAIWFSILYLTNKGSSGNQKNVSETKNINENNKKYDDLGGSH